MTVLVTGGAGYIGSHMVWALLDAGEKVVVVDRLSTGFRWAVPRRVGFYYGDVEDTSLLNRIFSEHEIDVVLHFAGSISVPESVQNPLDYYLNNASNTRNLIAACVANGVRKMVFSSTAAVYGAQESSDPVSETADLKPENPYGMSKVMAELMLRDSSSVHDFSYVALRYFNVAGADTKGRAGPSAHGAHNLIKVACEAAVGKRSHVDVYGTDYQTHDGTGVRDYIHVSDLTDAHLRAMRYLRNDQPSLVANCGYGHGYSVLDVIQAVKEESGANFAVNLLPRRDGDIGMMTANSSLIRDSLGWTPAFDDLRMIVRSALYWEEKLAKMPRAVPGEAKRKLSSAGFR
jgi:UDP-glucose 4-epimerase